MARNYSLTAESETFTDSMFELCSFHFPTGDASDYPVIRDQRRPRTEGL
jgi:hypothetical protein